jgi:hypothetical protein
MSAYKVYKVQVQMVDTFEIETDMGSSIEEVKAYVRKELEEGNTFAENREFISWDTGTVRVLGPIQQ